MHTPAPQEIDAVAEEASQDIRDLCRIWHRQGPAALDTAVRRSPNLAFAVLDGRRAGAGAVRLLAGAAAPSTVAAHSLTVFKFLRRKIPKFWRDRKTMSSVAGNPRSSPIVGAQPRNLFDCARPRPSCVPCAGAQRRLAMFETMTAVIDLLGAAIFLAHAFEGIYSGV
jgi:hypothetical protein